MSKKLYRKTALTVYISLTEEQLIEMPDGTYSDRKIKTMIKKPYTAPKFNKYGIVNCANCGKLFNIEQQMCPCCTETAEHPISRKSKLG